MLPVRRGAVDGFASRFPTPSNGASMQICKLFLILLLLFAGDVCYAQDSGAKEEKASQQEPSAQNTSEPDANKQDTSESERGEPERDENDGGENDGSEQEANERNKSEQVGLEHETNKQDDGVPPPPDGSLAATDKNQKSASTEEVPNRTMEPLASRVRAVRAIRFSVVVVSVLLSMLTTVVLMQVNRWSHGRYAGRTWWLGVLLVPAWLLVGIVWAWNNAMWNDLLDGTLLPF